MISNYPFNPERYFKLLKKEKELRKKNQNLNQSELLELICYSNQYFHSLYWEQKDDFLNLIKKFISYELENDDFFIPYKLLEKSFVVTSDLSLESLKDVKISQNSSTFSILISDLNLACDLYDMLDDFEEEDLRNSVKKAYQKYKKLVLSNSAIDTTAEVYFELEEYPMGVDQSSKELVNRFFKFLTSISVLFGILLVLPY